jgi:hypothetical protein
VKLALLWLPDPAERAAAPAPRERERPVRGGCLLGALASGALVGGLALGPRLHPAETARALLAAAAVSLGSAPLVAACLHGLVGP